MTDEGKELMEHIIYLGEVPLELVKKIYRKKSDSARYVSINGMQKYGIYRTKSQGTGVISYQMYWNRLEPKELQRVEKIVDEGKMEYVGVETTLDKQKRRTLYERAMVIEQLYGTGVMYLPREKPEFGKEFPYIAGIEKICVDEIREIGDRQGIYYGATEIKKKLVNWKWEIDDVLRRNRAAGLLLTATDIFIVYSYPKLKGEIRWSLDKELPIQTIATRLGGERALGKILFGSDLEPAKQMIARSEEAIKKGRDVNLLHITNSGHGELYYIPTATGTRMIEYMLDGELRRRMDARIKEDEQGHRNKIPGYEVCVRSDLAYVYNMMSMNMNALLEALNRKKVVMYCYEWQEDFIANELEMHNVEYEIVTYSEADVIASGARKQRFGVN